MLKYDIVVVGGGPAGLAAAIEAKKNGTDNILVIERDRELGGILQQCIHNGFGLHVFKEELTGPEYAERFINELKELGIEYKLDTMVLEMTVDKKIRAINTTDGYMEIEAKAIVLAMGCRERTRGAINIPGTRPAGIFTAGTAQRFVNMEGYMVGKEVVILGSGDIGLIMARRMTLEGAKVHAVVELMPYSGGLTRNIVQCLDDYNIPLYLSHTVIDIKGNDRVEEVVIAQVDSNRKPIPGTEKTYKCDTLLLSVGLIPENELSINASVQLDPITGGPIVKQSMETSIEGIFACGNVVHVHDLVDWVTEESRRAGKNAAKYVQGKLKPCKKPIKTKGENGVRYIVPQVVELENIEEKLTLMMRVDNIYHNAKLLVKDGERVIKSIKRNHLAPGEMETVNLTLKDLENISGDELTVTLEFGEVK
ncbi:Thioredoxin reductase [Anaerobranca californiensis DSM 14826]|jgi:NADPH-dependent 2,4-dienoyl-CoA reductase/sulfur reductase-like enzyme|uniref:Thioredoxin reductase n=1 Tax=Anaerobranca californiensis DSM 14826 TaxID=1120989 RepID=A0A1M6RC00_9FIRM|nr:FAD-dependent oxidoreductase [Anaerobranca californiensis]SHK29981.1 Thioredoxin reductase [Anaerobranca californiensis DSM 14826]